GTKDKDHSMLEFFPANKAWQFVTSHGFRTFIKIVSGKDIIFYEPFHNGFTSLGFQLSNRMSFSSSELHLEEWNKTLGLETSVDYFTVPNDCYAGLVRVVRITNKSRSTKKMQLLDGLPQIVPYGTSNLFLKKLSRTIEAWMNVENLSQKVPFYRLTVDPTDRPEVIHIQEGNFYLSFHKEDGKVKITKPIVDPETIFGTVTDFSCPREFLAIKNFKPSAHELIRSKTPSGFSLFSVDIAPGQTKTFSTVIGYMKSLQMLNQNVNRIISPGYLESKKEENKQVIADLEDDIRTQSNFRTFDLYAEQTYLDNILRGGYPVTFDHNNVFYLYSRKHGDLERDYNKFKLQATYFSQGNGNYRDINQNRRCDIWFNPDIKDANLIYFFNLLQTDGYNPLVVKGANFILKEESTLTKILADKLPANDILLLAEFLKKPFTPGGLVSFMEEHQLKTLVPLEEILNCLITHSLKTQEAEHGEGFWTDHWTYNLDLIEQYLALYPETLKDILFENKTFTFFDNTYVVKPRAEKYVLREKLVKQLQSVYRDAEKEERIRNRTQQPNVVRSQYGSGKIYYTTLINKLVCLAVNKLSSLDPFGMGIEMEADKPNWFDALNGLPALFGSSLCETFELKRLLLFIREKVTAVRPTQVTLSQEIYSFMQALQRILHEDLSSSDPCKEFVFWDKSYSLKEEYRAKTRLGLRGEDISLGTEELLNFIAAALEKLEKGIEKSLNKKTGIYYAYFMHEVTDYEVINDSCVWPRRFTQNKLPFFLESQMHALRVSTNTNKACRLHAATRASELFDRKLKMYKVTAPLASMPEEIGRCRVFTPGWLENESIWLHMEYKYLLELLKQGLYEDFYADFKHVLIPFLKPEVYGRSILENSSFLVSSAFPDKNLHGNGYVARLSGSTAEFINIWLVMNLGRRPFTLDAQACLNLTLKPALAGWLFDRQGLYRFNFLNKIAVIYRNPRRKNTFGKNGVSITKIFFRDKDGSPVSLASDTIPSPYAEQIRSRQINQIDAYLE
ncbi:MAG: hypothetical protein KKC84_06555, partial [Candidatus Omnitrophica bacterium]|nr:hypothetical protein [Candidatus Omnitrophota bacterium]